MNSSESATSNGLATGRFSLSSRPTRRAFCGLLAAAGGSALPLGVFPERALAVPDIGARIVALESRLPARIGVMIIDTKTGRTIGHRADERFPMCSTFKLLAAAAILKRVDDGTDSLERRVVIQPTDLVDYSPVTRDAVGGKGMTLAAICEAAITMSDNTAGNMLLKAIEGPPGLTAFARSIGDEATRLDRWETALNEATPGDPRDTTTPRAMAGDIAALVLGKTLSKRSSRRLADWMSASRTGATKLRAGIPSTWEMGDKTGGGAHGTSNEVAILWPPRRDPLVAAIFVTESPATPAERDAAIASIGMALSTTLSG